MTPTAPAPTGETRVRNDPDLGMLGKSASLFSRGPVRTLLVCGLFLIVAIAIGTVLAVTSFRNRALATSARELDNTVLLLSRHFDQVLRDFSEVQDDILAQIQPVQLAAPDVFRGEFSTLAAHEVMRARVSRSSDVAGVNIFSADGTLINSSETWPVRSLSIADRAFFKNLKMDLESSPEVLEIVRSRFTSKWALIFARRIMSPTGQFLGVITRGLNPDAIENFLSSIALSPGSSIAMFHKDGTLLIRQPHIESMVGQNFISGAVHQQVLTKSYFGRIQLTSPIDGLDRLASARRLDRLPISIIASMTIDAALAEWRDQTKLLVGVAVLTALVIAFILFLIVKKLLRQHQSARRQLDTALGNMTQGLMLYDASSRIVLFNRRYIEMYDLSLDVIQPGRLFRDVMRHRKETGSFEGDDEKFCSDVLQNVAAKQLTRTVVKSKKGRTFQIVNQPLVDGGWVTTHEDITELKRSEDQIKQLAHFDALTDLPNRKLFREQLTRKLANANDENFALLYLDIDEFKNINDSLGHPVGDEFLKLLATRLKGCIRKNDFVARLGGDEFAIIMSNVDSEADAVAFVEKIRRCIQAPFECLGHHLLSDASIGVAIAPINGSDIDQLIKNADLAMYEAKASGRRTFRFFEPKMDEAARSRRELEVDLREAISNRDFILHYQPIVDIRSDTIIGCEALLRWHHDIRGWVSPDAFIALAEDTGLIVEIGEWVLRTACLEAATWPGHLKVAVNVSPIQFKSSTFALKVASALAESGLGASRLELEITETVLIRDDEAALAVLLQLRELGVEISLDDFGTGYSSLSYLQRFPFDKIKIDRNFINEIGTVRAPSAIVQAVINIATARNMTTTAEGVETQAQLDVLRAIGCDQMQGYLFSPAKPSSAVRELFQRPAGLADAAA